MIDGKVKFHSAAGRRIVVVGPGGILLGGGGGPIPGDQAGLFWVSSMGGVKR